MTLGSTSSRFSYAGDGNTRSFPVNFRIWANSEVKAHLRNLTELADTELEPGRDFTIVTDPSTGAVSLQMHAAPPAGSKIVLLRDVPAVQELDLAASGAFEAENLESQLDRIVAQIQTLREQLARTPKLSPASALANLVLPEPGPAVAGQLLAVSRGGDGFELRAAAQVPLQTVSGFAASLLDAADAASARDTLGLAGGIDLSQLPTDAAGVAPDDLLPYVDKSGANASRKVPVAGFMSSAIAGASPAVIADGQGFEVMTRRISDGAVHRATLPQLGGGRHTIWIPAAAMSARLALGAATGQLELPLNRILVRTLDFDPAVVEYAQVSVQMPRSWNRGALSATFVWSHAAASGATGVMWSIRGVSLSDGDALDVPMGAPAVSSDTGGSANVMYRTAESTPLVLSGPPSEGDVVIVEVSRAATDPADTLAVDARLHGVALFYVTTSGSDA